MEVDPTTMMRISRALWPAPVAQSAPAFVSTLFRQNMQNVAKYFGYEVEEPAPLNSLAAMLKKKLEEAERRAAKHNGTSVDSSSSRRVTSASTSEAAAAAAGTENAAGLPAANVTADGQQPATATATATASASEDANKPVNAKDMIPFNSLRPGIEDAWAEFKKKLSQTWLPLRPQPPGGCVGVSGLVELQSANSRIMIEVSAFWDPKTRKYDAQTMHMKLRSIRPRNQVPL